MKNLLNFRLKTKKEIEIMREGGKRLVSVLEKIRKLIEPGVRADFLDKTAYKLIKEAGGKPAFLNYKNYPNSICLSINEEIVHGIPGSHKVIKEGDIVSIDIGLKFKGFCTDATITVPVGRVSEEKQRLIKVTRIALKKGIEKVKLGAKMGDVQSAIQTTIEGANFSVVKDLTGHGIGKELQEPPSVPNFGQRNTGLELVPGLVLALEPMATAGEGKVKVTEDGWTIETIDKEPAAHFEKTIALTSHGPVILTPWED